MATLKYKDTQKLDRLGFHPGRTGEHWCRQFKTGGNVKTVLIVRDTAVGFEYRTGVVNPTQREGEEQWLDAADTRRAIRSLRESDRVRKKARHALEGGFVRRAFRRVFR